MKNIAIFISGRGSNFINIHSNIKSGKISNANIALVFSNNKDADGLKYALENDIKTLVINPKDFASRSDYDQSIIENLEKYNIDFICLAGYMRIVTDILIKRYPNKIINIHPALLPSFPGLHSQKQALDYGVKVAGCTVHFVDSGVDTGNIIMQASVDIADDDTEETLSEKILKKEHILYPAVVNLLCNDMLYIDGRKVTIRKN